MIANITKGSSVRGALDYVHNKDEGERIAGNLAGRTPQEMEREWAVYRDLNDRVGDDVWHCSLSVGEDDELTQEEWAAVANDLTDEMGFDRSAWVAYRHQDTANDHVHIVANRIDFDGRAVDCWKDYQRAEQLCRRFEAEYGLERVEPSRQKDEAGLTRGEMEMVKRTGEPSVKMDMQARVEKASYEAETMAEYADALEEKGIAMDLRRREDGTPYGVMYVRADGEKMKGSDLGRAYGWGGLQKKAGIDYEPGRDDEGLRASERRARRAAGEDRDEDRGVERDDPRADGGSRGRKAGPARADRRGGQRAGGRHQGDEDRRQLERVGGREGAGSRGSEGKARRSADRGPEAGAREAGEGRTIDRRARSESRGDGRGAGGDAGDDRGEGRRGNRRDTRRGVMAEREDRPSAADQHRDDRGDRGLDDASIAPETRREIWREERIAERVGAGEEYADGELERGDVADRADFGDETTVVVTDDQERFDVVDVPTSEAEDVGLGDTIRISRVGETTLERQEDRDRGLDR